MPVRALRLLSKILKQLSLYKSESSNARQGIKTLQSRRCGGRGSRSESSNARQGIKTPAFMVSMELDTLSPNHRMPVRALRLTMATMATMATMGPNHRMPVRALRRYLVGKNTRNPRKSRSESSNARQGIKTSLPEIVFENIPLSESSNARQGIKTSYP